MLKVIVRFDKITENKSIKLQGFSDQYPEEGKVYSITVQKEKDRIIVDLGKVYNIKSYGDMLLIQTDLVVAEVWILGGEVEVEYADILPFVPNDHTLFLKNGKLTALKKVPNVLGRLQNLLKLWAEDADWDKSMERENVIKKGIRLCPD